ncbi:hypothetical protein NDU88_003877 [Pleurodeles waltl]|uniref:Uncharacterized protein n=1 Tax=Pleurodeles waltl TaxID=8319 RepID=A0AAV7MRU5_PLEWA|nr:hypothetical protein NDU88_003877 [Pleurodeles waltl]
MVAPIVGDRESIIVISDEEDEGQREQMGLVSGSCRPVLPLATRDGRLMQFIPRIVSPMLHKVQEWEVENQNIFSAGEQIEFVDRSGLVVRGTICGEASGNGTAGMAMVRLDFWQPGLGAPQSGCDSTHALGGREEQSTTRRPGQPACDPRLPVRVGAPSGHRLEERAKPGSVRLTSGEASGPGSGIQEIYPMIKGEPSTSLGAVLVEQEVIKELLDYEEEEEVEEMDKGHQRAVQKGGTLVVSHEWNK